VLLVACSREEDEVDDEVFSERSKKMELFPMDGIDEGLLAVVLVLGKEETFTLLE
jgi:hypothetical protein